MELSAMVVLFLLEVVATSSNAVEYYRESPLKAFDTSGHLDKSVTLRCQLITGKHNRGWYMIKWHRLEPDGETLPLIQLSARYKVPEWSDKIPASLKSRVEPIITVQPGHVEFNLVINNLTCSDEGDYRCSAITPEGEIVSAAELGIYAGPQTPRIMYDFLPPSQPTMIEASCKANVGFPPKMLVWYIKRHDATYFTIVDKQPDVVQETDGCHTVSTRTIQVPLDSDTRGTHFRCGYPGFIEKDGMYDQLVLDVDTQGAEEVRADSKMAPVCDVEPCAISKSKHDSLPPDLTTYLTTGNSHNTGASSAANRLIILIACAVTILIQQHIYCLFTL